MKKGDVVRVLAGFYADSTGAVSAVKMDEFRNVSSVSVQFAGLGRALDFKPDELEVTQPAPDVRTDGELRKGDHVRVKTGDWGNAHGELLDVDAGANVATVQLAGVAQPCTFALDNLELGGAKDRF